MNILITGAFGFVGRNLSAWLAGHGHKVVALDIARQELKTYGEFYSWDELEKIPWGEVDAVVHLAGKAHDTRNTSDAQSYFDINVGLTKKVLEAWKSGISHRGTETTEVDQCSNIGLATTRHDKRTLCAPCLCEKKMVFIMFSSVKAVADQVEGVLTEEAVPDPKTPYGQSKLQAEKEVLKFESSKVREFGTANGTNQANEGDSRTYILRPCMIHGPGNKGNLNALYGVVSKGMPWPLGGFENRRSFASIGNVCAVVEGLLKGDVPSGTYQVADDEALATNELISVMAETMGRHARIWKIPSGFIQAIARAGDVLRLPLNSERLRKLTESYVVSNAKIKRALGWDRMPVGTREGMRKTLESFGR